MNVLRSPTGSDTNFERSGSQPNLSNMPSALISEPSTITFRNKRKHSDGEYDQVQCQLSDIQKINDRNDDTRNLRRVLMKFRNDIAMIRCEIQDIRDAIRSTEKRIINLATNHSNIQDEIQSLKNFAEKPGDKFVSLESNVENLKNLPSDTSIKPSYEEILSELNNQSMRKKNIVIAGIPEPQSTDAKERFDLDKIKVVDAIKNKDCPEPKKMYALEDTSQERIVQ
ncbi:unnamed protein product [Parnassius apollo]|uniref:(apollo) hypothetical protein n=1 Tax=Parnassius apollo TaxID=110799 RepID=A0A8S3WPA6_PARAO|nr:unnamed protein product [Parnassius apollo]